MTQQQKSSNMLINLTFNIVIPVIILSKWTSIVGKLVAIAPFLAAWQEFAVKPACGLVVALLFPMGYFFYDLIKERKTNFISIVGFVGIFLTGIIGVFEFPSEWIAFKEAAVPLLIGLAVLISLKTPFPLVRKILYSPEVLDIEKIERILDEKQLKPQLDRTLVNSTYMLAGSFLLSSVLNFTLAKILIKSPTGTEAFTHELAHMTALSYPVIALPSTLVVLVAMWYLFRSLKKLTALSLDDLFAAHLQEKIAEKEKKQA